jgi:Terminase RNaseH-like domain
MTLDPSGEGVFLPRRRRFIVGVDLGMQSDPTAIAIIEHISGVLDFNSEMDRHTNTGLIPQKPAERYDCRYLSRLPLKLDYPTQVMRVADLMSRPPLCGVPENDIRPADLLVDATGVGLPVAQQFERAGLKPLNVIITSSEERATYTNGAWHVGKALLVSNLDALLNNGELKFAKELAEAPQLEAELKDFRRYVSAAGRSTWEARSGAHDDLVLAVGIAAWWACRPPPAQAVFGRYGMGFDKPEPKFFNPDRPYKAATRKDRWT